MIEDDMESAFSGTLASSASSSPSRSASAACSGPSSQGGNVADWVAGVIHRRRGRPTDRRGCHLSRLAIVPPPAAAPLGREEEMHAPQAVRRGHDPSASEAVIAVTCEGRWALPGGVDAKEWVLAATNFHVTSPMDGPSRIARVSLQGTVTLCAGASPGGAEEKLGLESDNAASASSLVELRHVCSPRDASAANRWEYRLGEAAAGDLENPLVVFRLNGTERRWRAGDGTPALRGWVPLNRTGCPVPHLSIAWHGAVHAAGVIPPSGTVAVCIRQPCRSLPPRLAGVACIGVSRATQAQPFRVFANVGTTTQPPTPSTTIGDLPVSAAGIRSQRGARKRVRSGAERPAASRPPAPSCASAAEGDLGAPRYLAAARDMEAAAGIPLHSYLVVLTCGVRLPVTAQAKFQRLPVRVADARGSRRLPAFSPPRPPPSQTPPKSNEWHVLLNPPLSELHLPERHCHILVVQPPMVRSAKLLCALSTAEFMVHRSWLDECLLARSIAWPPTIDVLARHRYTEPRTRTSFEVTHCWSLERWMSRGTSERSTLFSHFDWVWVEPEVQPQTAESDIKAVLRCAGAPQVMSGVFGSTAVPTTGGRGLVVVATQKGATQKGAQGTATDAVRSGHVAPPRVVTAEDIFASVVRCEPLV